MNTMAVPLKDGESLVKLLLLTFLTDLDKLKNSVNDTVYLKYLSVIFIYRHSVYLIL